MVQFAVSKDLIVVVLLYDFLRGGKVDTYQIPQNPTQAAARRDAIAKVWYTVVHGSVRAEVIPWVVVFELHSSF
jgi:hypothetical protein